METNHLQAWQAARRILCVRLDSLGDVLMTSPAFRALKSLPNQPELTVMTSSGGAAIARLIPEIDRVWPADVAWLKHTSPRTDGLVERELIERLRGERFCACVIFTVLTQNPLPSALLCYLADIPLRLGLSRENPYQLLTHWVPDTETLDSAKHEVERQLDLVAHIGAQSVNQQLSVRISRATHSATELWLEQNQLSPRRGWCVIHPGATASSRRYPPELFAQVAQQLEQLDWRIVVTGSRHEQELAGMVLDRCTRGINLAGRLDVEQLVSLIAHSPLVITGNTGPAHIAAAVQTPVVDLYALTNPQHTPWQVPCRILNVDVPCRNCLKSVCPQGHHNCLRLVTPEQVVQAALELIQDAVARPRDADSAVLPIDVNPRSILCSP